MESPIIFLAVTKDIFLWEFLAVGHMKLRFSPYLPHTPSIPDGQGIHSLVANSTLMLLKGRANRSWASSLAVYNFPRLVWIVTKARPWARPGISTLGAGGGMGQRVRQDDALL